MIVVADTSPLNYLVLIDAIEILPALFGRVLVPEAVVNELLNPLSPAKVRQWMEEIPSWLEIRVATPVTDRQLRELGAGESEAIQLALDLGIERVLVDEWKGRALARELSLQVEGTLGILERAAHLGLIDFRQAVSRLELTNFRLSSSIRALFLGRNV